MKSEIFTLTGVRFLAAFSILVFHIDMRWPLSSNVYLKNIISQGAVGMTLFFMLSGFILAYNYADNSINFKKYIVNRFSRIYPVYILLSIISIPWIGINFTDASFKNLFQIITLNFINLFALQAWFPNLFNYWTFGGTWSISVEIFLYVMFPLLVNLAKNFTKKHIALGVVLLCIISALPGLTTYLFSPPQFGVFYAMPIFRLSEFIIGIFLYKLYILKIRVPYPNIFLFVSTLTFFTYLALFGSELPQYIGHNFIVIPYIALILYLVAAEKTFISSILSSRAFNFLGRISYSFYLLQIFVLLYLIDNRDFIVEMIPLLSNNILLLICVTIILIISSTVCYYYVEERYRVIIKKIADSPQINKNNVKRFFQGS
ncbi:acyltransferase [Comamonas sp. Tr-654]|uniref:acyltransferase family protein n=1 Tax=Comamonas sp. Tr-654 TaxID=2608341 RepID=UPI0014234299|nr:acyltransferase [Comamonas sp. Tr-654]NIF82312.1 acyltransferase [Comamonas sp. Tr-654]